MSASIQSQLASLRERLGEGVTLVAVSKTKPDEALQAAYDAGHRDFGENRVQELVGKAGRLPQDIRWHMIGHVQTNKIKDFVAHVHLVHGVDRLKVLNALEKEAAKINRVVRVLLQVHVAEESTKFGFDASEIRQLAQANEWPYPHLCPCGLMGMATFTDDEYQVRDEFAQLAALHRDVATAMEPAAARHNESWNTLSMGMSGDWRIAVEEGSTMVRIGSAIFGSRP